MKSKTKKVLLKLMLILIICLVSLTVSSCTIGIKQKTNIVYSSMSKPLEYKGLIRVATNKKIKVTINNKPAEIDVGGYYIVHKSDLKKLLDIAKGSK